MKKSKLIVLVLGFVLCVSLVGIGVFAINYLKMNVTGQIDFISYDKLVYIEQVEVKNFVETTDGGQTYVLKSKVIDGYNGKYLSSSTSVSPINISNFSVLKGEELTIEIKMKSLSSASLVVDCSYNTVGGVSVTTSNTVLAPNPEGKISTGVSSVFSIVISSENAGTMSLASLNMDISFEDKLAGLEVNFEKVNIGATTQVDFYYLTMGTYKGEPVRWRYVSADGKAPYDASKGRPQSVRGYYVLETEVNLGYSNNIEYVTDVSGINQYHTNAQYSNIYVGDYATSNLRDYFIKTSGGLMSMLNISQDNEIYKAITPQSMAKLYENIYVNEDWDSGDVVYTYSEIPENARKYYASESTHADFNQATDKFFAPSMKEYLELGISTAWCYYPDEMSGETLSFGYWLRAMCGYVGMRIEGGYGLMSSDLFAGGQSGFQARAAFIIS